jgi:glucose/arabinose dehydrogenase
VTGLDTPWDIAFQPTGAGSSSDLVFTENNTGKVAAIVGGARRDLGTIAGLDPSGEGGLMGLAFHPDYPAVSKLYVCFSTASDNRVATLTVTRDGAGHPQSVTGLTPILTGIPHAGNHNGCRVRFQPGSTPPALFVTTGDAAVGPGPQDVDSLAGKVLRLTDAGAPYGNVSGKTWFTKGHRNPQGIAFRPGSNVPFSAEHGPDRTDEVNLLSDGGNAGWNPTNGSDYDQTKPMTGTSPPLVGPIIAPTWISSPSFTIAPSGITFLSGGQWKSWDGGLVIAVLKNNELRLLQLDGPGTGSQAFQVQGSTGVRLRSAVQGPDGFLYVATDVGGTGGAIWKVTPS